MIDKTTKPGDEVTLEMMNVILKIPKEAVSLELTVGIIDDDGELRKVFTKMTASEIREIRQDFLDNVEGGDEYDALYVITEEGRRRLEELKRTEMSDDDIADGIGQAFSPD